ncbi:hypothetical protein PG997_002260 [Apiospora hydei]|uniref:Heterokaryon incompatibility domain-containing protein n=1 Tax=Apiospora hydei TaxID=1337664 RepID=A0ABR1X8U3_9PEZI
MEAIIPDNDSEAAQLSRRPWLETPLDLTKSQIRLLTLHRGRTPDPLVVGLHVVSLDASSSDEDDSPNNDFETLSYVWGDPSQTIPITVSGVPFDATRNLAEFLRCLRLPNAERVVWADAICIDQTSVAEKSHQIGLMARIYRQASKAAIWFGHFAVSWQDDIVAAVEEGNGEDEEGTAVSGKLLPKPADGTTDAEEEDALEELLFETLSILDSLVRGKHLWEFPLLYCDPSARSGLAMNRKWPLILDCVRWLLTRPWWSRVWTLQEAVLPRVDAVVYIGTLPVRFSRIINGGHAFSEHWLGDCCKRVCNLAAAGYQRFPHRHWLSAQQRKKRGNRDGKDAPFISIVEAISSTQWRRATNPRDHFFGVLGLLPQVWNSYFQEVGYGCSAGSLFAQCTKLLYVNDGHLRQLGCAIGTRRAEVQDLPSWAIDLSRGLGHDEDGADRWALYDAYPGSKYDDETSGVKFMHDLQDATLQVKGIYIGNVAACAICTTNKDRISNGNTTDPKPIMEPDEVQSTLDLVTEWKSLHEAHRRPHPNTYHSPTSNSAGDDIDAPFWRTAFMDRDIWRYWLHKCRPLPSAKLRDVRSWWRHFAATGDCRDLAPDQQLGAAGRGTYHYRALTLNMEKCRFFCMDGGGGGGPGLEHHDAAVGDEIFILAGCRSPEVLRPIINSDDTEEGQEPLKKIDGKATETKKYRFVGLCFVDGWMYGKAESQQRSWQSLELY